MAVSLEAFKRAIVRVMDDVGQPHGMGVAISPNLILTCAHVVASALGISSETAKTPSGTVRINLPFLERTTQVLSARVLPGGGWFPNEGANRLDLALLEPTSPLTTEGYACISSAFSLFGLRFTCWGAQEGHEHDLIPVRGRVDHEIANGRYVVDVHESNYKVRPGCSGAPAIDETSGLILGLIAQEELDESAAVGFLIPVVQIRRILLSAKVPLLNVEGCRLEALQAWAKTRYNFRSRLRPAVLRFIENYREGSDERRTFVGRATVLQDLDRWLIDSEQPFRLLTGAAGRGKSTLILHWLDELIRSSSGVTIIYFPISIRFNIADEMSGLELLFSALCDNFSDIKANFPQKPDVYDYLEGIAAAWSHIEGCPQRQFLLVVDGLDEAANQWFLERRILPPEWPMNLKVLVSARNKSGHGSGAAWLRDIGVSVGQGNGAFRRGMSPTSMIEVSALDRAAMTEAVIQLGHPLDRLAEREAFVEALYRLTDQGDPLLLTLWLGQIWSQQDHEPNFDAAALANLRPSFSGFYAQWMGDQQLVWKERHLDVHPDDFGQVMHILAQAQGSLLLEDIAAVLGHLQAPIVWEYAKLRTALELSHRLLVGNAQKDGYALVHPRLAVHFREELEESPRHLRAITRAFRAWGINTVSRLNNGELPPDECPRYLLKNYVATHIASEQNPRAETIENECRPLLRQGWALAWYACEGSWQGYLSDLRRVRDVLRVFNQHCIEQRRPDDLRLAIELRCVLLAATIRSMTENLPARLCVVLSWAGIWSIPRTARVALLLDPDRQAQCLAGLMAVANERGNTAIVQSLSQQALEAAAALTSETYRARALTAIAGQLQGELKHTVLQQALETAAVIESGEHKVDALIAVAAQLQGEPKHTVLQQALETVAAIKDDGTRANALSKVATQLHGEPALLQRALEIAAAIDAPPFRARALNAVAAHLRDESKRSVLQQALAALVALDDETWRALLLDEVAIHLRGNSELLDEAWAVATEIRTPRLRAGSMIAVAAQFHGERRRTLLQQAVDASTSIEDPGLRAGALTQVAAQLEGSLKRTVLQQALGTVAAIRGERSLSDALCTMAPLLHGEPALLEQALSIAAKIERTDSRVGPLGALAEFLTDESRRTVLQQALAATAAIGDERYQASALSNAASLLKGQTKSTVLQHALAVSVAIQGDNFRATALNTLAAQLHGGVKVQRVAAGDYRSRITSR